jgi:hypothetical protein
MRSSGVATTLVWIMALLAVIHTFQRVAAGADPDMPTLVGVGAILYLGYASLPRRRSEARHV